MVDRREEIIYEKLDGESDGWTTRYPVEEVKKAMDEYFTERALELLQYMANNRIECGMGKNGPSFLQMKNASYETLTAQQLFENFL